MHGGIGVGGIGFKALTNEQTGFAVRITARPEEFYICSQRKVAAGFGPNKIKRIGREPHVRAATDNRVDAVRSIVSDRTGISRPADIGAAFERGRAALNSGWNENEENKYGEETVHAM